MNYDDRKAYNPKLEFDYNEIQQDLEDDLRRDMDITIDKYETVGLEEERIMEVLKEYVG